MNEKKYIVLSGASGVGKSTVLNRIRMKRPDLTFAVSWTTRPPREEEDESSYSFVSNSQFEEAIRENTFVEWVCENGIYYGTPKSELAPGERIIFDVDTRGGLAIKKAYPEAVLVFLTAEEAEIRRRLQHREKGRMDPSVFEARMARLEKETARALEYYDYIIENIDMEACVEQILRIIDTN